ncbi:uncharacterized protein ATNIH1004_010445 [Aspergillus tanneri]|uniref:Zn(2)-C6 fungal-type domain-containing protein n=1 Tax=Aspergillus tanneri TaxID=1220188 RepID=A0A5M9MA37_9EURO|nr:uncharacterized protein ATNIH1004_010445 [Aspergillus tanneri]KAA8643671.1 hypothetical protein ATNIH1004_010445 [Aspergillus tanneri]
MPLRPSCKAASWNGCLDGSNWRTKCTNEQTKCSGCLRNDIVCQYSSSTAWDSHASPPITPQSLSSSYLFADNRDSMTSASSCTLSSDLNTRDLELMVQWCTATYRSIAQNSTVEWIWHAVVPREAMHYPSLMHGILALSALHLSNSSSGSAKDAYLTVAQVHHSRAIVGVSPKAAGSPNLSDCNATFALSSIMMVYCFGIARIRRPAKEGSPPLQELCAAFQRAQESANVLAVLVERVSQGELRPLLECDNCHPKMPNTSRMAIMTLSRLNMSLAARDPGHEKAMYDIIIEHLGHSLDKLARGGEALVILFYWIFNVPTRFQELLKEHRPLALVILAHYAVVIHSLRGNWWMGDLGARIIEYIGQRLSAEWRPSIDWVLDATGCYIPPI